MPTDETPDDGDEPPDGTNWTGTLTRPIQPAANERRAQVAQLVEHATENRSVGGSTPPLGTIPFQ